jgi:hypothetical protein
MSKKIYYLSVFGQLAFDRKVMLISEETTEEFQKGQAIKKVTKAIFHNMTPPPRLRVFVNGRTIKTECVHT